MNHSCPYEKVRFPQEGFSAAIENPDEKEDGTLWIGNDWGEYTQINYCPYCGYKAKNQWNI